MGQDFTLLQMLKAGWMVMSILFVCSIISFSVILERLHALRRARMDAGPFTETILKMLGAGNRAEAVAFCGRFMQPLARVVRAVLLTKGGRADKERMMLHALRTEMRQLEMYVPVLGTLANICPLIGLFGTITGIIKAFQQLVVQSGGGPEVVSAGVAEALITTAAGLIVAVPAVVAYNYCLVKIRRLGEEIELYVYPVMEADTGETGHGGIRSEHE